MQQSPALSEGLAIEQGMSPERLSKIDAIIAETDTRSCERRNGWEV